jgi:hypothetical protein
MPRIEEMRVLSVDPSARSCGLALWCPIERKVKLKTIKTAASYIKKKKRVKVDFQYRAMKIFYETYNWLMEEFGNWEEAKLDLIIIEGYAVSAGRRGSTSVGMLGEIKGLMRAIASLWKAEVLEMPIGTWKALASVGIMDKNKETEKYIQRAQLCLAPGSPDIANTDEADAVFMLWVAVRITDMVMLTKNQRKLRDHIQRLEDGRLMCQYK